MKPPKLKTEKFDVEAAQAWDFEGDTPAKAAALKIRASHAYMEKMATHLAHCRHAPTATPHTEIHTLAIKTEEESLHDQHGCCCGDNFYEVAGKRVQWRKVKKGLYRFTVKY